MLKMSSLVATLFILAGSSSFAQWSGAGANDITSPIYRNGNVGIGTTAPTAPTGHLSFGETGNHLTIGRSSYPNKVILATGWLPGYGDFTELRVPGTESPNVALLRILHNGNVGIGTATPTVPLSFGTSLSNSKIALYDGTINGKSMRYGLGIQSYQFRLHLDAPAARFSFLSDEAGSTELMTILGTGNIGIGITSPEAKLAVNGDIHSKKIKVTQAGWPDYVFDKTYLLRTLSEVEQYIQLHHHLPEVPSAAEVEKGGVDLGDNQATLLKKIEELTLYVIDQNKRLSEHEKQMEVQLKMNRELKGQMELQQRKIEELKQQLQRN